MSDIKKIDRRDFLKSSAGVSGAGLLIGYVLPEVIRDASGLNQVFAADAKTFKPNLYVSISVDNKIELVCHRSEMGQGVRTSMPMLLAEELEVDLDQIKVVQADGDKKYGDQNTDGSTSVRLNWEPLRKAGATAREMLVGAAAKQWGVDVDRCYAKSGQVHLKDSKKAATYGSLAIEASKQTVPKNPKLKPSKEFKLIGRPIAGLDAGRIAHGKAMFGIDVQRPGLVYASIERAPTIDGTPKSYDEKAALKVKGVKKILKVAAVHQSTNCNAGIAVIADNSWAAMKGREALNVKWNDGDLKKYSSDSYRKILDQALVKANTPMRKEGDAVAKLKKSKNKLDAQYFTPYMVHAPMEPLSATAEFEGKKCLIWAPSQDPQRARQRVADFLKTSEENVEIDVTMLGGGFGRKSQPDFVVEVVQLAKQLKGPVKLCWTREDEVRHGFYHAACSQSISASWSDNVSLEAWHHKTVFPTILRVFNPKAEIPAAWEVGMGASSMPFQAKNVLVETGAAPSSVRVGWMRAVCHVFHSFAINSFVDELAALKKMDVIDLHLKLIGKSRIINPDSKEPIKQDTGRLKKVTELVRGKSDWHTDLKQGVACGFASHYSFNSYVATVVKASMKAGQVIVKEVHCAVDCGSIVNPDTVRAQIEGSVAFGLSIAKYGEVNLDKGKIVQSNFHDYQVIRHSEMPKVFVHIVNNGLAPTGIGEPGTPPVAPALVNAIYRLTGKRVRELPLVKQGLA